MQIDIVAVGRMKAGPEQSLYERYADRFAKTGKPLHLFGPRLSEIPESRAGTADLRKREESAQISEKLDTGAKLILLDERGKDLSSEGFAEFLKGEQENSTPVVAFALGGPDGHGEELRHAAALTIRFGAWTWPHQLARILLAEQLYRAATILSGHPYHRA